MSDPALVAALVPGCENDPPCILHEADADKVLDALAAAGYAVVRLPEGVAVPHGARLVPIFVGGRVDAFTIEATPSQKPPCPGCEYCGVEATP